jgi:hypothetical protein
MSVIARRWAEHAAEAADANRSHAAAEQLRHLIASDVPLSATAESIIAAVADQLDPQPGPILDQTGPGMFRCVCCGAGVATVDVFAHRCRVAS